MNFRLCKTNDDCIRACLSTLLDRDDVPHLFDGRDSVESWKELRKWLSTLNKTLALFPVDDHETFMRENNENVTYILLAQTINNNDHAVVCKNGEIIHDPAWIKSPITNYHSIGCYIILIIGDLH